jgi:hypothetical protein
MPIQLEPSGFVQKRFGQKMLLIPWPAPRHARLVHFGAVFSDFTI